jgi:polysaccharide transporter, PST family
VLDPSTTLRLLRNIASITALQASGYILAIVNVPYLTRTLGVTDYGVLTLTVSVNAYLYIMIDWGFSLGATRDVAQAQSNPAALRDIFWRTMTAKGLLAIVALITLLGLAASDGAASTTNLVFPGVLNICGAVLSVDWLALGLERMGLFSVVSIAGRALVIGLMFALVHGPQDTWIACCLQGFSCLVGSSAGFLLARRYLKVGRPAFPVRQAAQQIWNYRHYFLSQSSRIAYTAAAPLLLTFLSGSEEVGLFAGAERIVRAVMGLIVPLSTAMYPYINALVARSRGSAAAVAGLLLAAEVIFGLALALLFLLYAKPIVAVILGAQFSRSADVLRYLAPLPLLAAVSGTLSNQWLIPLGWHREVSRILIVCAAVYLGMLTVLIRCMGPSGAAVAAAIALVLAGGLTSVGLVAFVWQREKDFALVSLAAIRSAPGRLVQLFGGWVLRFKSS